MNECLICGQSINGDRQLCVVHAAAINRDPHRVRGVAMSEKERALARHREERLSA